MKPYTEDTGRRFVLGGSLDDGAVDVLVQNTGYVTIEYDGQSILLNAEEVGCLRQLLVDLAMDAATDAEPQKRSGPRDRRKNSGRRLDYPTASSYVARGNEERRGPSFANKTGRRDPLLCDRRKS